MKSGRSPGTLEVTRLHLLVGAAGHRAGGFTPDHPRRDGVRFLLLST